ncbi:putative DEAD-box ATP-dependent RNA helicase 8-like [Capsicum annuum]|nr:putative DEAD-box ATP-dependent RNA helicase 8-like [Capsicum annuum]
MADSSTNSASSSSISTVSMEELGGDTPDIYDCEIRLMVNPQRRKEKVYIGCGAGFGGDRPIAALKLLQRVKELDYLVLECLAERTLAERYQAMKSGGKGYDPRNDPFGARDEVLQLASGLGISITVGLAHQVAVVRSDSDEHLKHVDDVSVYLGAAPIVECLQKFRPNVIITSRVADASLFLAPMVYELGWNWNDLQLLSQGSLAGHLLECGCQLTGGYYMHPGEPFIGIAICQEWAPFIHREYGDKYRDISLQDLLDLSLPFAEVSFDGKVCIAKAESSGGVLNPSTCAEQLLYEVGDPSSYITPDVVVDFQDVSFQTLSSSKVLCAGAKPSASAPSKLLLLASKDKGWKGWGEISYGGYQCVKRAKAADFLVRSWMEEVCPGISKHIVSYIIGLDSLKAASIDEDLQRDSQDIRLRMDGLFENKEQAIHFTKEFIALYTNGPAGGGGIRSMLNGGFSFVKDPSHQVKGLHGMLCTQVNRKDVQWHMTATRNKITQSDDLASPNNIIQTCSFHESVLQSLPTETTLNHKEGAPRIQLAPAPHDRKIPLYDIAHSRAGDKGDDINLSLIPYFPPDIERLKKIVTQEWVEKVVSILLNSSPFPTSDDIERRDKWVSERVEVEIYEVRGIHSLNIVVRNILDGGVNCSRRIDRHGKTLSDLLLCQKVLLPL